MALMQQTTLHIAEAGQEVELKLKRELDFTTKEQIVRRKDVWMATDGFADSLIALESKIDYLERFRATSLPKAEITKGFANALDALRHNGS